MSGLSSFYRLVEITSTLHPPLSSSLVHPFRSLSVFVLALSQFPFHPSPFLLHQGLEGVGIQFSLSSSLILQTLLRKLTPVLEGRRVGEEGDKEGEKWEKEKGKERERGKERVLDEELVLSILPFWTIDFSGRPSPPPLHPSFSSLSLSPAPPSLPISFSRLSIC